MGGKPLRQGGTRGRAVVECVHSTGDRTSGEAGSVKMDVTINNN